MADDSIKRPSNEGQDSEGETDNFSQSNRVKLKEIAITLPLTKKIFESESLNLLPRNIHVVKIDCQSDGNSGMIYFLEIFVRAPEDKRRVLKSLMENPIVYNLSYKVNRSNIIAMVFTRNIITCNAAKGNHAFCANCLLDSGQDSEWKIEIDRRNLDQLLGSLRSHGLSAKVRTSRRSFTSHMTEIQRQSLTEAAKLGYFNVPRVNNTKIVAKKLGISEALTSERIRTAVKKVITKQQEKRGIFTLISFHNFLTNYKNSNNDEQFSSPSSKER